MMLNAVHVDPHQAGHHYYVQTTQFAMAMARSANISSGASSVGGGTLGLIDLLASGINVRLRVTSTVSSG